jgi:hypothetical protein
VNTPRTPSPARRRVLLVAIGVVAIIVVVVFARRGYRAWQREQRKAVALEVRKALWNELQPVALKNCTLRRYGSVNDGGYLMCENLLGDIQTAYSYGIDTEDNWGCEVSQKYGVTVHQYDCFTPHRPTCDHGKFVYHNECIGPRAETIDARPFDTLTQQIAKNGDSGKTLLVKMDIEGAEWDSLLATPNDVLDRIAQLPMELHGVNERRYVELVKKLKQTFHLVSVHFNNWACSPYVAPFPANAIQVLFVNKRLGVLDPGVPGRVPGSPPDAPDNPNGPDCQTVAGSR